MLALNVGVSVALQDILTRKDRLYSLTMWGVVTMNRVVATIILRLIISRTIPIPTAMMIGDIKHQSKSAGKRKLFQLSLIASWWSKHCMAILSILCTDRYISTVFGKEETERLFALYKVGTSKKWGGSTIFWQIDVNGNVHTGKIMKYDDKTGHRIKEPHSLVTWVHSELKLPDFTLRQCFFGEHLLTDKTTTKTIAIVESEKTAIIATHFMSDFVWLATGGMNGCFNKDAVEVLSGREVVLVPDLGATDKWKSKLPLLQSICKQVLVSNILEDNATDEQKTNGLDIADFLLMTETPQMALQRLIKQHPPLQHLIDSLGLVLVEES